MSFLHQSTIEKHFGLLKKGLSYYVSGNNEFAEMMFCLHFINDAINKEERTIIISDINIDRFTHRAKSLNFNLKLHIETEKLLFLEIPADIKTLNSTINNIALILNDLKIYIDNYEPDRVIFYRINSIMPGKRGKDFSVILNRIAFFINNLKSTTLMFVDSSKDAVIENRIQNIANGKISISFNDFFSKTKNKILFDSGQRMTSTIEVKFKYDYTYGMLEIEDNFVEEKILQINHVLIPSEYEQLSAYLRKLLGTKLLITKYTFNFELQNLIENSQTFLVFLRDYSEGISCFQLIKDLRMKSDDAKFVLCTSRLIASHHRKRAAWMGFDAIVYQPFDSEELEEKLSNLFYKSFDEFTADTNKTSRVVTINAPENSFFKANKVLSYASFLRVIKRFAYQQAMEDNHIHFISFKVDPLYIQQFNKSILKIDEIDIFLNYETSDTVQIVCILIKADNKTIDQVCRYIDIFSNSILEDDSDNQEKGIAGHLSIDSNLINANFEASKSVADNKSVRTLPKKITVYPLEYPEIDDIIKVIMNEY
ncbi:MAG: ATPase domain-containing protein [Candidatus Cloacimonetes bacterium]|nr:ATPase domain-containing protein [Candidatus Cloacimonadota bacterium]